MSGSGSSVQVHSVETLIAVKTALAKFGEESQAVVTGMDMDLRRAWYWLDREMPAFWQSHIKRLEFEHSEAKSALFRKRLQAQGSDHAAYDTAEKELVRKLDKQLELARAKLETIRRWRTTMERAADEYNARVRGLRDQVEGGIERDMEILTRMVESIQAYSAIGVPTRSGPTASPASAPLEKNENEPES
jgi:hypothetical protein